MAKITVDTFLEYLERSRILSAKQLEGVRDLALGFDDATEFARLLTKRETLTRWQAAQLLAGRTQLFLAKYKLLERLGRGGMGNVFLAEHTSMNRRVALKVVSLKGDDSTAVDLLRSEARAIGLLDHPNIIQAYDVDSEGDRFFIVMEYVPGQDLNAMVMDEGPLPMERAVDYIRQAAEGLAHAHDRGMIHCDIKPSNLLVDSEGVIKILDLGVARLSDDSKEDEGSDARRPLGGTIDYQAPEHARDSADFDSRADIYSLGCTLYCLLAGHPPFPEGSQTKRILQHQTETPPDLRSIRPDVPADLNEICLRMLEKAPEDRFQTAEEVAELLGAWTPPEAPAPSFGDSESEEGVLSGSLGLNSLELNTLQEPFESSGVRRSKRINTNTLAHLWIAAGFVFVVVLFLIILILSRTDMNQTDIGAPIILPHDAVAQANEQNQDPDANTKSKDDAPVPNEPENPSPADPATSVKPDPPKDPVSENNDKPPVKPPIEVKPNDPKPKDPTPKDPNSKDPKPEAPQPIPKPEPVPVFNTFPRIVPLWSIGEAAEQPLGALEGPADAPLSLELLGGSFRISSETVRFTLEEEEPGKAWKIELNDIPIANIRRDINRIIFQWEATDSQKADQYAEFLQYTILRLTSGKETRDLLFTQPVEIPPLTGDFQKHIILKRPIPKLPINDADSFRVEITKIIGPAGAVAPKDLPPLSPAEKQQALPGPKLNSAEIELTFILSNRHDSINLMAKYRLVGKDMVSLSRSQVQKLLIAAENPRYARTAQGAAEVLALVKIFAETGKVHFRAYRQIGDKQLDLIITKDPPPPKPE